LRAGIKAVLAKERLARAGPLVLYEYAILEDAFHKPTVVEDAGASEIVELEAAARECAVDEIDAAERAAAENAILESRVRNRTPTP
jgi:hypothetical protein